MSSANCCTTQKSPSPNNLAPRPVCQPYPPGAPQAASRCYEIETDYLSSASPTSPLSKPDDVAELQAIFDEDKTPIDDRNKYPKTKLSSASLTSVKNKLKKHLSRELRIRRRHSRSSVGTSEEDIERRAELRRIRQRRIQEELSNDLGYDSDAKSLPTITGVDSAGEDNGGSWNSRRPPPYSGTPALSPVSQTSLYLNERGLQLEERLYGISLSKSFASLRTILSEYNVTDSSNIANTPCTQHLRRHSSPSLASLGTIIDFADVGQPTKFSRSFPPIPTAPALKPQRPPSFLSKSSWRLSFASENRGAYLRSLSQDETLPHQAKDVTSPQPINRWLRSQGLRSTSQVLTWSDDNSTRVLSASHSRRCSTNHVDETETPLDNTHMGDMIISQCLAACLQCSLPSQQLSNVDHGLNYPDPSNARHTIDRSHTIQKFPLMEHYTLNTNDNNASFSVSDAKSFRESDTTIRASRNSSIDVPAFDASRVQVPSEVRGASTQLFFVHRSTTRAKSAPITKSFDGSIEKDNRLTSLPYLLAITPYSEDGSQTTDRLHNLVDDEIAGAWSKAVYLNTSPKNEQISHNLILPNVHKISSQRDNRKSAQIKDGLQVKTIESCSLNTGEVFKYGNAIISYNTLLAQKEGYFNNWGRKLNPVSQRTKFKRKSAAKSSIPDRRYPASWSKFSSHERGERTESATVNDLVDHVDFAIASVQDGETVWYINERSNHLYHHEGDDHESHKIAAKNGLFEKWEKKIKDKFHQMESVQTDVFLDRTRGRRGSLIPSLPVEYPELELLPGDMMTAAQIETYAKDQLEEEEILRQEEELKAIFSTHITSQGSIATARRPSKWKMEANNANTEQLAPESIELDNLTPTKSTAQRSEARKSRKKAVQNIIMPISFMRAREQARLVDTGSVTNDNPQLTGQRDVQNNVEQSFSKLIDSKIASIGTSSKTQSVFDNCKQHPQAAIESGDEEQYLNGTEAEIGSSGFYNDCIVNLAPDEAEHTESSRFEELLKYPEKGIFGTWSPGDWERYKDSAEAGDATRPMDPGHLRKSTDDFHIELQKMERLEREKALRIAKEAWGSGQ